MGNINTPGLQTRRFSQLNLAKTWDKHSKEPTMHQAEFMSFMLSLSSTLSAEIDAHDIGLVFNRIEKSGLVNFHDFASEFEEWSNKKIEEIEGVEVLQPKINLTLINKYYQLNLPVGLNVFKRFPFHNPSEEDKTLKLVSSDSKIMSVRTPILKIKAKEVEYIRLKFKIEYQSEVLLFISHFHTDLIEETLSFKILPINLEIVPSPQDKKDLIEVLEYKPTN